AGGSTRTWLPWLLWKRLARADDEEIPVYEKGAKRCFQHIPWPGTLAMGLLGAFALSCRADAVGRPAGPRRCRLRRSNEHKSRHFWNEKLSICGASIQTIRD